MNRLKANDEAIKKVISMHEAGFSCKQMAKETGIGESTLHALKQFNFDYEKYRINYKIKYKKTIENKRNGVFVSDDFKKQMIGYSKDEIIKAYQAFCNYDDLLDVVPCKCSENNFCYPHYLRMLKRVYFVGRNYVGK